MRVFARAAVSCLAVACLGADTIHGQLTIDLSTLSPSVVRILVRGATVSAASGFIWLSKDQVVTALHAVPGGNITATCRGESISATVSRVLPKADLALLKLAREFAQCRPLLEASAAKPATRSQLLTLGFHATASMTSRSLSKEFAEPETLGGLISGPPLEALRKFGIPATDLDIYYVQGGLLPGYSGAPVFNVTGELIGIADGGLNKGQDDYNWVIPAGYLNDLMASAITTVPAIVTDQSALHFSTGIVQMAPSVALGAGGGRGGMTSKGGPRGATPPAPPAPPAAPAPPALGEPPAPPAFPISTDPFELIKTQSLSQLARTSDDPTELSSLLQTFKQKGTGKRFELNREFDIYADASKGFLFAAPVNARVELVPATKAFKFGMPRGDGFVNISFHANDDVEASDGSGSVPASDPRYFQEMIRDQLADCQSPMKAPQVRKGCYVTEGTARLVDFGNGNRILKFGYSDETGATPTLDYMVVAVRGRDAIYGTYHDSGDDSGNDDYLSGVFSLNLITFPNLTVGGRKAIVDTTFDYDDSGDNDATIAARYYEGSDWRFYHARGKLWHMPDGKGYTTVVEQRRDANLVYLKGETAWFAVPIKGGTYQVSADQGQTWKGAGAVKRR